MSRKKWLSVVAMLVLSRLAFGCLPPHDSSVPAQEHTAHPAPTHTQKPRTQSNEQRLEPVLGWAGFEFRDRSLFPETAVFDPERQRLLVGSVRLGGVHEVDASGASRPLVVDPSLCSVLGIAVDFQRRRIVALNSELGVAERSCGKGPRTVAGAGIYDLDSGRRLHYVDLAALTENEQHIANAVALDTQGNAYISDSLASCIYKVDVSGSASVWWKDPAFSGAGIALNGLAVHPRGYLLVVKKSDGALFRMPLEAPSQLHRVALPKPLSAADGLLLTPRGDLLVVANQVSDTRTNSAFVVHSADDWHSATISREIALSDVYPTVPVLIGESAFFLSTHLGDLLQGATEDAMANGRIARLDSLDDTAVTAPNGISTTSKPPGAFVLAELQLAAAEPATWNALGTAASTQPGFQNLTWLVEEGCCRIDAFLAFDDPVSARHFANTFFPVFARRHGAGQSTKLFDAAATDVASRDMSSVFSGGRLKTEPQAFVYTEVQVDVPFSDVPWRERNPVIRANPGFLAKTWLTGVNTHTVGGLYAFDTFANARRFAQEVFPAAAAKQHAAFTALVFRAAPREQSSRTLGSPFFRDH